MQVLELNAITDRVIGCSFKVANTLGSGFLERVYENALAHELRKSQLGVESQKPIKVLYDNVVVGEYVADLLVEQQLLVELKAVKSLDEIHTAQCLNYLNATGLKVCLLINFGSLRVAIKRLANLYCKQERQRLPPTSL
jgi:GxxExxY protein